MTRSQRRIAARKLRARSAVPPAADVRHAARIRETDGSVAVLPLTVNPNRGKRHAAPAGTIYRDPESQERARRELVGQLRIVSPLLDTGTARRGRSTLTMDGNFAPVAADVSPPVAARPSRMARQTPAAPMLTDAEGRRIARTVATDRAVAAYRRGL